MRTLSFTQYLENYRDITINIKDEELFRQNCEEWSKEEGFLSFWNFEDEFFEGCVEVSYGDIQTNNEEKDMETKQELVRLYKWIAKYKIFAYNFHMKNYIQSDDMYVSKEDAAAFGARMKILRAPFLPVFEEIEDAND